MKMGNFFGCIEEVPEFQRLDYDMTPVKSKKLPIIWVVGPPGSGRNTHADKICDRFGYENIKISELVKEEASNESERGRIIKETFTTPGKRVSDAIVVDLIKETMLERSKEAKGYVLNGFPRSSKQALYFVNEVDNVDAIIYLYGNTDDMVNRVEQENNDVLAQPDAIRKSIINYLKEMKDATQKFGPKVEKIYTDRPEKECFSKIETAITSRISELPTIIKKQITVISETAN